MDLDIKYIIVAVGTLLIVAIIGHHVWRAWRVRQSQGDDGTAAERTTFGGLWDDDEGRSPDAESPATVLAAPLDADAIDQDQGSTPAQRTEPHIAAPDAGEAEDEPAVARESQEPEPHLPEVEETVSKARSVAATRDRTRDAAGERTRHAESREPSTGTVDEYVAIWVVAKDGERFSGDDLLRALRDARLEYGARNVFHRRAGDGSQFMVVNGTEPGTFDLAAMSEFSTPAVVATMTLPGPDDPIAAFNAMLTTARALEAALGGTLKDEELNAMSYQTIEHCRSRVAEFARRQMSQRP